MSSRLSFLADDPSVRAFVTRFAELHGEALSAVLAYGSYLRGTRDTILDFYVVLGRYRRALPQPWHAWLNWLLPPNVYFIRLDCDVPIQFAKYATLSLDDFERAMRNDFHPYFWARFAQPTALVYAKDEAVTRRVLTVLDQARVRFVSHTAPLFRTFNARQLWIRGLNLSYRSEVRAEPKGKPATLVDADPNYYTQVTANVAESLPGHLVESHDNGNFTSHASSLQRLACYCLWPLRRWSGKILSGLRIVKAAVTFNDPLDYALWKIRRHSGVYIEPTARQRRHPLFFAWGLLWQIYRRGGFR